MSTLASALILLIVFVVIIWIIRSSSRIFDSFRKRQMRSKPEAGADYPCAPVAPWDLPHSNPSILRPKDNDWTADYAARMRGPIWGPKGQQYARSTQSS